MKSYRREIERLVPQLRQYARALVPGHRADIADDLVHDVLAHALRAERSWIGEDLEAKLYTRLIGANRLRLRADVSERRSAPGHSAQAEAKQGGRGSDFDPLAGDPVGHGLDALPLTDREALLLVVLCRLDYAKVADILGVPIAALISRLTQARDRLGASLWASPSAVRAAASGPASRPRQASHLRLVKS